MSSTRLILIIQCADRIGIVAAVSAGVAGFGGNIAESQQFTDASNGQFFMRVVVETDGAASPEALIRALAPVITAYDMTAEAHDAAKKPRVLLMVSKFDHVLRHLLYQIDVGWIPAEVVAIASNHERAAPLATGAGVPFFHVPISQDTKLQQEAQVRDIVSQASAELVVLARYMQVLSKELATELSGRAVNIHHSFLPGFKGAKPYHQAWQRGVKLIGATAHYVTPDLDEGPIIEQETERVHHGMDPAALIALGRTLEARVCAAALKLQCEHRVMINGHRTVVFS